MPSRCVHERARTFRPSVWLDDHYNRCRAWLGAHPRVRKDVYLCCRWRSLFHNSREVVTQHVSFVLHNSWNTHYFRQHGACLVISSDMVVSWWRHQMETFSALLAICAGNSPVTGEFPAQRPVTRSFDVFFDLRLKNAWVNNREAGDLRRHRAHFDVIVMYLSFIRVLGAGGFAAWCQRPSVWPDPAQSGLAWFMDDG